MVDGYKMKQNIKYYACPSSLDKDIIEYSDDILTEVISELSQKVPEFSNIHMCTMQVNEYMGTVLVTLFNKHKRMSETATFSIHDICLTDETFKDCVKELQREKRKIKNHFKGINVTSDFSYR